MTTKLARADSIESRVELEAGPAANNPGPRAVLRQHAPSATRQRTLEANGIDRGAGPVLEAVRRPRALPDRAGGADAREPRRGGNPLAGTRQESQRSVAEHANDHQPWRAGTSAALLGLDRRVFASTRPDSRPSPGSRSRGGPLADKKAAKRRRRENKGSAREGEGRAHRPVAGSAGRGRPERRGRGSTASRTPHRSGRLGGRRHRRQQPTVAVTRCGPASTSRASPSDPDATVPDEVRSCELRQVLGVAGLADDLES